MGFLGNRLSKKQRAILIAELNALPPDAPRVLLATGKLVVVHLAASEAPRVGEVSMGRERTALWQGVTEYYGQR